MRTRFFLMTFVLCLAVAPAIPAGDRVVKSRWVYLQMNLQVPENAEKACALLRRAAAAGYDALVLADYKLNVLDRVPAHYFTGAKKVIACARELGVEIIPAVAPFGYSSGILAHDPDLAEGLPVRGAPFVVRDGVARLESARENLLPGGSFEEHHGDVAAGFDFQDGPGKGSFIDTDVRHGGRSSIRFENPGATMAPHGNARVMREVTVSPWREYHASVWLKTEGWGAASDVRLFAMGEDGRVLSYSSLGVRPTQDWTEHHVVFNSLSNSKVRIYCGTWGGRGGKLWMDDLELEETAFVNLVRREGCPLAVRGEAGTVCTEGRDYEELHDPRMGCVPWPGAYEVWHEPPTLRIPRGSRIREGAKLRVDFFHAVTIHDGQVACCLGAPGVFRVLEDQVRRVVDLFHPKTLFLEHDEIRVANWCDACRVKNRTAGGLLAENMRKTVAVIRKIAPGARLAVWSDMFDPFHNAHDAYYLVNGDLSGAWEGLPEDMIVVNWNRRKAKESLPFFGKRGHEQVLAGYYDGDPADIAAWWKDAADAPGVDGVMYTTWRNDFSALETFARAAWGGRR